MEPKLNAPADVPARYYVMPAANNPPSRLYDEGATSSHCTALRVRANSIRRIVICRSTDFV